jgi:hypothetical protein
MNPIAAAAPDQRRDLVIVNLADLAAEGVASVCGSCIADYIVTKSTSGIGA